jgi:WD40 repeat protein
LNIKAFGFLWKAVQVHQNALKGCHAIDPCGQGGHRQSPSRGYLTHAPIVYPLSAFPSSHSMARDNANPCHLLATLDDQHDDTIAFMQFSPCGEYLVTGGDDLRMKVFDCANNFENILSVSSTSPASTICWDPNMPKSFFVGYSTGAVVSHTFGNDQDEWAAEILLFNGRCRVVALAWDNMLAVATERNVFLINNIKASESV